MTNRSLNDLIALTDESGPPQQFLCYGGVFALRSSARRVERVLSEFCAASGFADRELSWKKCSRDEVSRYCDFAELFWTLPDTCGPLDFRCMVVDTRKYPVIHPASGAVTWEQGFYRFYSTFLSASVDQVKAEYDALQLVIAPRTDKYAHNADILEKTIGGRLRGRYGASLSVTEVDWSQPRASRLHQLGEVLVGAVSFRFNEASRPATSHKRELCEYVEGRAGQSLSVDFKPDVRPFNVWAWTRPGDRRWNRGASGSVPP